MLYMRLLFALLLPCLIAGCSKDDERCPELKDAIVADKKEAVRDRITLSIMRLPSQDHTEQNLEALASSLSAQCAMQAKVLCFSCIQTFPEQSEIRISFMYSGSVINKTIDISHSPDKRMRFVNMHD